MVDPSTFARLVPGFDFLQNLAKNAGAAVPGIGQWVAPTLNPEELSKRIDELRTVQFWLEQNVRMLGATIQALEVQRMTLSTLKTMNVQMNDLRDSLLIPVPTMAAEPPAATAAAPVWPARAVPASAAPAPTPAEAAAATPAAASAAKVTPPAGVDPMQWWGALTQQFTELAAAAMKDGPAGAARTLADAVQNGSAAADSPAPRKAAPRPAAKARKATPRKRASRAA